MRIALPDGVLGMASRGDEWADWVARLPRLAGDLLEEWELRQVGIAQHGFTALVLPVVGGRGAAGMLKIASPDEESEHEHLALTHWNGVGAVRLLRADPRRGALLLERLQHRSLRGEGDLEACGVVGGLYGSLHVPAFAQLRLLSDVAGREARRLASLPRDAALPHRLVEQAAALARDFATDAATDGTLIHADLHYDNVLAAEREPWLVIDPKPLSGDPHYELAPMLWNRYDELAGRVREGVRSRFHTLVDVAGLDEDRARDWVIVRMMANAASTLAEAGEGGPDAGECEELTVCVSVAKAVQE